MEKYKNSKLTAKTRDGVFCANDCRFIKARKEKCRLFGRLYPIFHNNDSGLGVAEGCKNSTLTYGNDSLGI